MNLGWLAAFGLAIIVLAVALSRLGLQTWVKAEVESTVRSRFEKELEGFRSEIRLREAEITALQSNILSGRAGRQALLDTRRLGAIEQLWRAVIKLNAFQWPAMMITFLKLEAIDVQTQSDPKVRAFFETLSGKNLEGDLTQFAGDEECRLYVPEEV